MAPKLTLNTSPDHEINTAPQVPAIGLDLHIGGLSYKQTRLKTGNWPSLERPKSFCKTSVSESSVFYPGAALSEFEKLYDALKTHIAKQQCPLIIGLEEDPFIPFEGKFDAALRIIEQLASLSPPLLCIQTRSPLIVLCCPVLKPLGERTLVSIHLETRSDLISKRIHRSLPRPSERLQAARALKNLGIPVNLVCSPPDFERGLKRYAHLIAEASDWIQVCQDESKMTTTVLLKKYLDKLCPEKLNMLPASLHEGAKGKLTACTAA